MVRTRTFDPNTALSAAVDLFMLKGYAETSMDDAWTLYVEQRESLDHVAEALRLDTGDRGLLSSLGMAGRDTDAPLARMPELWDAGEFTESAEAAEHLIEDYESSVGRELPIGTRTWTS